MKVSYRRITFAFIFSLLVVFGCAGTKIFDYGNTESGFILTYRGDKGDVMNYRSSTKTYMVQEMMGTEVEIKTASLMEYGLKIKKINADFSLGMGITFNKFESSAESPQGSASSDAAELIGKSAGIVIAGNGKLLKKTDFDKLPPVKIAGEDVNMDTQMRELFTRLPIKSLKIGDTWEEARKDTVQQSGLDIIVSSTTTYTLVEQTQKLDMDCLKFVGKSTLTMQGEGNQMGADLIFEGDGEGKSEVFFAHKTGTLISADSKVLMEGMVLVSGPTQMSIPLSQEITSSLELIR